MNNQRAGVVAVVDEADEIEIAVVKPEVNPMELRPQQQQLQRPTEMEMAELIVEMDNTAVHVDVVDVVDVVGVVDVVEVKEVRLLWKKVKLLPLLHQTVQKMFRFQNQNLPKKEEKKKVVRRN